MSQIGTGNLTSEKVVKAAQQFATPFYLYDEAVIIQKCRDVLEMPNAYGLKVHYAMKANGGKALLQLISQQGLGIDASSINEVKRAFMAGIPYDQIMLTTQDVPLGQSRAELEGMLLNGLKYNICSIRQLQIIAEVAGLDSSLP